MQFLKVVQCQLDLIPAKRNQSANSCRNSNVQETINVIAVPVGIFCADTIYICLAHIDNCLCVPGAYRQLSVCAEHTSAFFWLCQSTLTLILSARCKAPSRKKWKIMSSGQGEKYAQNVHVIPHRTIIQVWVRLKAIIVEARKLAQANGHERDDHAIVLCV